MNQLLRDVYVNQIMNTDLDCPVHQLLLYYT